jgi:hypothetical protein
MPRYYFDLQDGEACVVDEEGVELINIVSAQLEAVQSLADMVKGVHPTDRDATGLYMSGYGGAAILSAVLILASEKALARAKPSSMSYKVYRVSQNAGQKFRGQF